MGSPAVAHRSVGGDSLGGTQPQVQTGTGYSHLSDMPLRSYHQPGAAGWSEGTHPPTADMATQSSNVGQTNRSKYKVAFVPDTRAPDSFPDNDQHNSPDENRELRERVTQLEKELKGERIWTDVARSEEDRLHKQLLKTESELSMNQYTLAFYKKTIETFFEMRQWMRGKDPGLSQSIDEMFPLIQTARSEPDSKHSGVTPYSYGHLSDSGDD
jgi:hypothetical protein